MLTELEGAILSEIHHRGSQTAFRVRRSFALSPSLEWQGSAGSVYPAIKRLEQRGLIKAELTKDARASRLLSLTAAGETAMWEWSCDPVRASSVGIDPFRMRAGIWAGLSAAKRKDLLHKVRKEIGNNISTLESFARNCDAIERASVDLSLRLQKARLDWLDGFSGKKQAGNPKP